MTEHRLRILLASSRARRGGPGAVARYQRERLADLVDYARRRSPYFREFYRDLPDRVTDPALLPVTGKASLMARFDDWVTDPDATLAKAQAFTDDPALIGESFLGRYSAVVTSGTSGLRGLFLQDARSAAVTSVLAARMLTGWLGAADIGRVLARGGRIAMVNAVGGHYASAVAAARMRRSPLRRKSIGVFGVDRPLPELVEALNAFRPALVTAYAGTAAMLATEQQAGRLDIDPVLVALSAEGLAVTEYDRIAAAFGATVRPGYAATECPFLSYTCAEGWLHVNADWVLLEPVEADHSPTPPGRTSHTVLVTNLANRIQPILRYDLGDAVLVRPDPCPCGDPLPAVRVQGRTADLLTFPAAAGGDPVTLAPLALTTALDHVPGVERAQLAQTAPANLDLHLRTASGADREQVQQAACNALREVLDANRLGHIAITRATAPPRRSPGGKFRPVVPLSADAGPAPSRTSVP